MFLRVLSLDGGGIRGVFAAHFLQNLEALGKPLHKCFDLVVGTSTGGIIALAIAYEKPMRLITQLYSDHAAEIFSAHRFGQVGRLFRAKYSNAPLAARLKTIFGETTKFESPSCSQVRIQSYNLQLGMSKIFRAGIGSSPKDAEFLVWQIAAATSAAPIYFPTFVVEDKGIFVDGGIWANNPSLVGILEALRLGVSLDQIRLLSIGTGARIFRDDKPRSGYLSWRGDLVEMTFQSQSDGVDQLASVIAGQQVGRDSATRLNYYKRVTPTLRDEEAALDQLTAVSTLRQLADVEADKCIHELERKFVIYG
jgi:predicted acylesterase/phospholipase RssA